MCILCYTFDIVMSQNDPVKENNQLRFIGLDYCLDVRMNIENQTRNEILK